ncbi:MAG: acetoacetate decarboxylase family protein [Eubacterium aggregans]|uniref:acetoacetate decarboxylase family protein n=1 Tax=Eubacterium aggregans TaxID=81409 RepID=UPI002B1ED3AB|nr:acetoacetate decarboxylase family protein [Eubacterium aggregans]MEA5074594.1 acetoacetate decarboxylase family protein [Eubacterium aggregans]
MKPSLITPKEKLVSFMSEPAMNNQYGIQLFCLADQEKAQALLPPPLKVTDPALIYIYAVNIREPTFAPWYMEGGIGIMAEYKGRIGVHFIGLQLDGPGAFMGMLSGREGSGLPKKLCDRILVERIGDSGHCAIWRDGVPLLEVDLDIGCFNDPLMERLTGGVEKSLPTAPIVTEGNSFLFQYHMSPSGFTDFFMSHYDSPTRFLRYEPATAKVRLSSTINDPWGEIPIKQVVGAGWIVSDNWIRGITKIHQYTDSEATEIMPYLFTGRYDQCTLYRDHQIYF